MNKKSILQIAGMALTVLASLVQDELSKDRIRKMIEEEYDKREKDKKVKEAQ